MAIFCILASIAYPTYTNFVLKAQRRRAQFTLFQAASELAHIHLLVGHYQAIHIPTDKLPHGGYRITLMHLSPQHFLLKAIPNTALTKRDNRCGSLSINETGKKFISGTGDVATCWY